MKRINYWFDRLKGEVGDEGKFYLYVLRGEVENRFKRYRLVLLVSTSFLFFAVVAMFFFGSANLVFYRNELLSELRVREVDFLVSVREKPGRVSEKIVKMDATRGSVSDFVALGGEETVKRGGEPSDSRERPSFSAAPPGEKEGCVIARDGGDASPKLAETPLVPASDEKRFGTEKRESKERDKIDKPKQEKGEKDKRTPEIIKGIEELEEALEEV